MSAVTELVRQWSAFHAQLEKQLRILVVDDEPVVRLVLTTLFQDAGYEVAEAETAEEGWGLLQSERFDLLVTDKNLPGKSGVELIAEIQKRRLAVPSLLITGFPSLGTVVEALYYGAADYLTKPFDNQHVMRRVRSVLNARMWQLTHRRISTDLAAALRDSNATADVRPVATLLRSHRLNLDACASVHIADADTTRAQGVADFLVSRGLRVTVSDGPPLVSSPQEVPFCVAVDADLDLEEFRSKVQWHGSPFRVIVLADTDQLSLALSSLAQGASDFVIRQAEGMMMIEARARRVVSEVRRQRIFSALVAALRAKLGEVPDLPDSSLGRALTGEPEPEDDLPIIDLVDVVSDDDGDDEELSVIDLVDLVEEDAPAIVGDPLDDQPLQSGDEEPLADYQTTFELQF